MLSSEERFELVLDVLQRLEPEIQRKHGRRTVEFHPTPPPQEDYNPLPVTADLPNSSLEQIIRRLGPMPPFTAIFGQCHDGLPFLFDLDDPEPGSILITGEPGSGKVRLLQTILSSAAYLNRSHEVGFAVITPNSGNFEQFRRDRHCRGILPSYDRRSFEWLVELCEIGERRRNGRGERTKIIQVIDDLKAFVQTKEEEVAPYLRWLIQYGPLLGIWVVASIDSGQLRQVQQATLSLFGTVLHSHYSSAGAGNKNSLAHRRRSPPNEFSLLGDQEEIRFWVPAFT